MSGYTKSVTKSFVFEGDEFKVTFRRLKRKHLMLIMPEMQEYLKSNKEEPDTPVIAAVLDKIYGFIEEYITCITGLKDAEGEDISVNEFFTELYFMEISTKVAMTILEESLGPLGRKSVSSEE